PRPTKADTIVVFSPHQDDETLGAGGYMSEAIDTGAQVYVVFATDGNHLHLKVKRQQEAYDATQTLGIPKQNLIFYNYPDGQLKHRVPELDASIMQTLQSLQPTNVFVTDPSDIHPDHGTLGKSV